MKYRNLLLLATLLSTGAAANPDQGPYAGFKLGFTDYSKPTLAAQYGLTAGYDVAINPQTSVGIEFNAIELGDSTYISGWRGVNYRTYSYSAIFKPKYHLDINGQPAYFAAIAGVSRVRETRESYIGGGAYQKDRDYDTTGIYGLELGNQVIPNIDVIGYYHYQRASLFGENNYYRSMGVGINVRF